VARQQYYQDEEVERTDTETAAYKAGSEKKAQVEAMDAQKIAAKEASEARQDQKAKARASKARAAATRKPRYDAGQDPSVSSVQYSGGGSGYDDFLSRNMG
jgi:hypothetical protein